MSVRQLPNGNWIAEQTVGFKPDGSRDRRSRTVKTKRAAVEADRELSAMRAANKGIGGGKATLDWFIENIWKPEKRAICTYNTFRAYESHVRTRISPSLGKMRMEDINHSHVQHMISSCPTKKTAQNARSTLFNILQLAVDMGYAPRNAADSRNFRMPREKGRGGTLHGEWLTDFRQHREVIEKSEGTSAYPILVLGLCFGLRKGEILGLDWEDVDLDRGMIHISKTYVDEKGGPDELPPKTDSSVRDIPMTEYAKGLLEGMMPEDAKGPVVRSARGGRMSPSGAGKAMARFTSSCDVPKVTILSLRHSFATSCIRAGVNVASVSAWLGHSSVTTTLDRYVRPLQKDLRRDVADVIDSMYG